MQNITLSKIFLQLVIFILFSSFPGYRLAGQDNSKPFKNSCFAKVDSVMIHYRIYNSEVKNPKGKILFIHGVCSSTLCWRRNVDTLVKSNYKVLLVDLPGFGYSSRDSTVNNSQTSRAKLLWDLLSQLDGDDTTTWNLVGHSMGGGTVEAMALTQPHRTKTVTIVDGMVFMKIEGTKNPVMTATNLRTHRKILSYLARQNILSTRTLRKLLKKAYGYEPDSAFLEESLKPLRIPGTSECFINMISSAYETCKLDVAGLNDLPVLAIWGKNDRTIPLRHGRKLKKRVPSVELVVIPEAYHMVMESHANIFNQYLVTFLSKYN
ncbi:MAG: alpha/beta hydrolase [Bacteroidetes bacterium]|nr:alpha/beta hydrolase [Bacteroidota bacterium]